MVKSVYIHIPFCKSMCSYCDFCKVYYKESWADNYLKKLREEVLNNYKGEEIETIYIGGGTPSSLNINELNELFSITNIFNKNNLKEFTIEVNPEDIEKEKIENNKNQKIDLDWINKIKAVGKIDELNKFIVNEFIDNIYVTENRNIKIDFKFDDQYEDLIKYLKSQKIMI